MCARKIHEIGFHRDRPTGTTRSTSISGSEDQRLHQPCMESIISIVNENRPELARFEHIYKDLHRHPELSCREARTASIAAEHLKNLHFTVHQNIGGHGVVGVLENGPGRIVLLRADLDALPIFEETDLPYASNDRMIDKDGEEKPVMHACGHDTHITSLMATATLLKSAKKRWSGTLICLFQPNEEHGGGARSMVEDGLYERIPIPDVVLGQHVCPLKSGVVAIRAGPITSAASTLNVRIIGKGGHGSEPQNCIDPVLIAGYILVRLQSIVSRSMDPGEIAVVTCGSIQGGDAANVIPDHVDLKLNLRTYSHHSHLKALEAIKRIVEAECDASATPQKPIFEIVDELPPTINDKCLVKELETSFKSYFKANAWEMARSTASEDFSILATAVDAPYAFWNFGGTDPTIWDEANREHRLSELPSNHSSLFAPVIEPTLRTGLDAFSLAALTFLKVSET